MVVAVKAPTQIVKRNGSIVIFNEDKIYNAISKCLTSVIGINTGADDLMRRVVNVLSIKYEIPTVEQVQDVVEFVLQSAGEYEAAKHYILYRAERTRLRNESVIDQAVLEAYSEDEQYFPTQLQRFQHLDKYSRWNDELGRRETWKETVSRAVDYLAELYNDAAKELMPRDLYKRIYDGVVNMEVMPSMRLMAMAGPAARRDNAVLYNCSYLPIDSIESFREIMSVSMAGCGVGFSVEWKNVKNLPEVAEEQSKETTYLIQDSAEGWADALNFGLHAWFDGWKVDFDYSDIRPNGTPLKIKGGRASGPEPLKKLFDFCRDRIRSRAGKKLTTLDAHDIACMIGGCVVSGGVRRTAMLSLFDKDDQDMLQCKSGDFEVENNQRWNANNSLVINQTDELTQAELLNIFNTMVVSGRGEPGFFNRQAARDTMPARRKDIIEFGTNPCAEIILRPRQFCNLTSVIAREDDTLVSLKEKVRLATIIGTIQSTATYFPSLSSDWKINCDEERLLGVDITGQRDSRIINEDDGGEYFSYLMLEAIETNKRYAEILYINPSAAITCNKPSGNTSQLVDCSSGIHARWAHFYTRNVRVAASSPLASLMLDAGVPMKPENGDDINHPKTWVVSFPVEAPNAAIVRDDLSAIDQCEWWKKNKLYWTEHNPSVTITYTPDEVLDVVNWIWHNKHIMGGMAFFPKFEGKYDQLPYIEITEEQYIKDIVAFPVIPFHKLPLYEKVDHTTTTTELACSAGLCEV